MSQIPLLSPPYGIEHRKRKIWLNVKHYSSRIVHWEYFGLLLIIAVTLALHFAIINRPPTIVWDETYYVEDARSIISGAGDLRPEHPPLAKLFVVAGIHLFGDNSFGWRFFSIMFGTAGIAVFYLICRKLRLSWKAAMIATFLLAFENMTFLHSSLALLDVYMVTLMLVAVLFYLHEWYILAGVFAALSAECKLAGGLIIIALFLHWIIFRRTRWKRFVASLFIAAASFVFFLVFFDYFITGTFGTAQTLYKRLYDMFYLTDLNKFTIPKISIASRPWTWIYPQWIDWGYNTSNEPIIIYSYDPQYISFISSTVQILIIPTIGYMIYRTAKGDRLLAPFILFWFLATYLVWIPLDIVTNRVTFVFYFLSTIPAIVLGIGYGISEAIDKIRDHISRLGCITKGAEFAYAGIGIYLFLHFGIFMLFNPVIPVLIKTWEFGIGVDPTPPTSSILLFLTAFPLFRRHRGKFICK